MKSRTLQFSPWLSMFSLPLVVSLGLVTAGRSVLAEAKDDPTPRTLALVVETQDTDKDKTKTVEIEKEVSDAVAEASNDVREATETVRDIVSNALKEAGRAFSDVAQVGRSVALSFRRGGAPWALVLPGDRLNADQAEQMTEDLAVMTKILRKAARPGDGDTGDWRGGPALVGLMPSGLGPDAFYLDGFGALFLISVDFPLVGPKEDTGQREEAVTDETWEQTRRELRDGGDPFGKGFRVNNRPGEASAVYRPDRVNALRDGLIDALKHATHVGAVPTDETIAVAVFCPPARNASSAATYRHRTRGPGSQDEEVVWQSGPGPGPDSARLPGSVMGLRVRKGDIDAFAKGKMDRETFVKKVQISTR